MDTVRDQLQQALGHTYRVERELGGGGMSRVFLATELALDRQVVLKVLPDDLAGVSVERFKREISLAARLQHAHIVPLLSAGDANGRPWFSMPFVDGESLRGRLGRGELPIPEVVRIMRDVASALAYAHGKGVVHRDIKPENILIADGSATVTDFGVSKAIENAGDAGTLTSLGVALGTPAYMAPEQAGGDGRTDHRADIYALGVVAWEMLSGRNPFAGRSPQATLMAHMTEVPPPVDQSRPTTPPALAQLVTRCLAKSAADRPQSAQDIVHELDALATPTGTMPLTAASRVAYPPARARMGRPLVIGGSAAVVFIAALGGWALLNEPKPAVDARRVAVMPFQNLSGDTALSIIGRVAAEELARSILQTDSADVAASTAVEAALGENGSGSGDAAKRVAEATQAGIVVLGSYSRFGDSLRMQASLVNPRNGKVIRAIEPSTGPLSDPMIAIGGLRERLLGSIVTGDLARQVTLASSPPKYSAWLEYMAGSREFNANNNQAGSRPYFERAIALDSTFAVAYGFLAVTYTNAGRYDQAEEVVRRLEAQRDRLSSYDRLVLDYQRFHIAGDIPQIVRLASEVFARSADPIFAYSIGFWSLRILRPDLAIPALKASHDHETRVGWEGQARDEALAFHQAGDYRAQLAALDSGTVNTPDGASGYRNSKLSAYAGLGDAATALALADTLLRQATPGDSGVITAVGNGASEFDAHGDSATASQLNLMTLRWADENHSAKPSIGWERAVGTRWLFSGNLDSAQAHLERALPDSSVNAITTISYLAIIAVQHGDSARARFVVDSIAATVPKWDRGRTPFVQAVILAELGERARALQLLKTVPGVGGSMINWHTALGLRSLRGYAPFEALITPRK